MVFLLQFLVNVLLLMGSDRLAGYAPNLKRAMMGALAAAVYALVCLAPGFSTLGNTIWRLVSLGIVSVISFGWNISALQRGAIFGVMSFALSGITPVEGGRNRIILLLYALLLWLLCSISRGDLGREYIPVELAWGERIVRLLAMRDTGNLLRDPLTGEQILVAGADVAGELLDLTPHQLLHPVETVGSGVLHGLRLIPYQSVGQPDGLMVGLRLKNVKIGKRRMDPLVAFAPYEIARGEVYRMLTGGKL